MISGLESVPSGLFVIARNASGQIVTHIISHRDLMGALHTGRCVLKLKLDAVRVEVHYGEGPLSEYREKPLALVSHEDLEVKQQSV